MGQEGKVSEVFKGVGTVVRTYHQGGGLYLQRGDLLTRLFAKKGFGVSFPESVRTGHSSGVIAAGIPTELHGQAKKLVGREVPCTFSLDPEQRAVVQTLG